MKPEHLLQSHRFWPEQIPGGCACPDARNERREKQEEALHLRRESGEISAPDDEASTVQARAAGC